MLAPTDAGSLAYIHYSTIQRTFIEPIAVFRKNVHNGVNCKLLRIFQKSCGRIRKIVVEYTLREQPGFYTWRLDRLDPAKGGCHMTLADILMCSIALCQLVVMVIALFQGK